MNVSAAIADVQARDTGQEAEEFPSKARLFPLATSLVPLAWPVGAISPRTVMNNAGYDSSTWMTALPLYVPQFKQV